MELASVDSAGESCDYASQTLWETSMTARLIAASAALALLFSGLPALAAGEIRGDGFVLSWEEGDISLEDLSGDASGVRIRFGGGNTATADRMVVRSRNEGRVVVVERFHLSNLMVEGDAAAFTLSDLDWRQLRFEQGSGRGRSAEGFGLRRILDFGRLKLTGFNAMDPEERIATTVDEFLLEMSPVRVAALPGTPLHEFRVAVSKLSVRPTGFSPHRHADVHFAPEDGHYEGFDHDDFIGFLGLIDRDALHLDINAALALDEAEDRVNGHIGFSFDGDGLFEVGFRLSLGLLNSALRMHDPLGLENRGQNGEAMARLALELFLNRGELYIRDNGFQATLKEHFESEGHVAWRDMVNEFMFGLEHAVGVFAPQTWTVVRPTIRSFLERGGRLSASMHPTHPVSVRYLAGFAAAPDAILSILGFSMRHERDPR